MVNATSCHPGVPHDPTCLLQVGDHPFIRHTSYILYAKARIVSQKRLQTLIAAQTVIPRPPKISQAVFERIVAGLGGAHANPEHLAFYNANK
ncbi:hypothetical protein SAMN02982985_01416 [Rugamonas rubra]|uniref:Uncharacterized protein n=2 Tax=Rugamonas rubra TaxID=758825 RepID=A0A1I4KCI5_9BURK|nr:hypothetical protein SAMN02982985_01416 [Rugamonas rubra]